MTDKKKLRKLQTLHELFPDFTTPEQLEELDRLERKTKKAKKAGLAEKIILPDEKEIILPDDFDIKALMAQAEDPLTGTMRNLRIDDRDLKHAKNYWDYSANIIGKDANMPWAKQMWTGLMLHGEVCTYCTKSKYLEVNNIPKDLNSHEFPKLMTLLEHGVCPKCGRHKWDLIKNHNLMNYLELVNVLGQRSGKSSSSAGGYAPYDAHCWMKFPNLPTLAPESMQASTELTTTFVSLNMSKAIGVMWTPFKRHIEASKWWCLSEGTQITMADGTSRPIEKVNPGDTVKTFEGQQEVAHRFNNGVQDCYKLTLEDGKSLEGTKEHQVQCLGPDGESLVWKQIGELTADDFVVVT